jgi:hypothetical protein
MLHCKEKRFVYLIALVGIISVLRRAILTVKHHGGWQWWEHVWKKDHVEKQETERQSGAQLRLL